MKWLLNIIKEKMLPKIIVYLYALAKKISDKGGGSAKAVCVHKGGSAKCTLYAHMGGGGVKKGRNLAHVLCTQSLSSNVEIERLCKEALLL